ncbi:MAG: DUF547 domain-containing protein [Woeseia sp.]
MKSAIAITLVVGILVAAVCWLNRPRLVTIDAAIPEDFPSDYFSHQVFEGLLRRFVDRSGNVDYQRWLESTVDLHRLDSYLAAVSRFSPESTPRRFETRQDELAYWIYAYNAYVIRSILDNWPLESVTNVKAPLELVKGLGFFYQNRYVFGGEPYSLYAIENDIIRANYRDARTHFVLNCGSESCPVLRPELASGDALEPLLQKAAADFVSDSRNVSIDHDRKEVVLSAIFKWFRSDFINDLRRRGLPADRGLVDYIASVAPPDLRDELLATDGYEVVFSDYDWAVNQQR